MPRRSRDNKRKLLPKNPTPSRSNPSFFFGDYELPSMIIMGVEDPRRERPQNFDERIGEGGPISHAQTMDENKNNEILPMI